MEMESLSVIWMDLLVDGQQSLIVLLAEDGTVNRLGNGTANDTERTLFIGTTNEALFAQLRDKVKPEWIPHQGAYDMPEKKGTICTLTLILGHADGHEDRFGFRYGSESQGPPLDICKFVEAAVRLTDPWYEQQKLIANGPTRASP